MTRALPTNLHTKTLTELSAGLAAGDYTSRQLTQYFLDRIEAHDDVVNSYVTVTAEQALAAADAADASRAAGQAGPLTGIPIAHKDIFCTEGVRSACGSKMLDAFVSPYTATVVQNMNDAGLVMLGKTNMDEFAMGSSNETSFYGPVVNPWGVDAKLVPGGSSGGAVASVAAGLAPCSTGTDTGGSIRQPAAFTNLTGLKPTYGRCSRYGMIAFASSLDQAGPIARTAEDCALLLGAMAGFDDKDSTSIDQPVPDYAAQLGDSVQGKTLGVPKEFLAEGLSDDARAALDASLETYRQLGAEVIEISLPNVHLSVPTYYVVAPAEASSNLARFDGVRYGHRAENPQNLEDLYFRSRGEGFGAEVQRRIMVGTYVLSAGYYDAYYLKAQKVRHLIADDFNRAFEQVDAIIGPTTQGAAFAIGELVDDPVTMYLNDIYTIAANLAGLPGLSMPAGMSDGKPLGVQLVGKAFDESGLLNLAHQFQQATEWHKAIAPGFE